MAVIKKKNRKQQVSARTIEKLGPSYIAGRNGKVWWFLKKLELLYNPAGPLLGRDPKKLTTGLKHILGTQAALPTIVKTDQSPSTDKQINRMWPRH